MELTKAVLERRSVRKYTDEKIDHEVLKEAIEVARFYPSWKNTQIARFIAVEDRDVINRLADEAIYGFEFNQRTMKGAPMLMVVAFAKNRSGFERDGSYTTSKEDRWEMFDSGIAAQTLCLTLHDKGIASCILGIFEEEKAKEILGLKDDMGIGCIIAMGKAAEEVAAPKRKEPDEILSFR